MKKYFTKERLITGAIILGLIIALFQVDSCRNSQFKSQEKKFNDSIAFIDQKFTEVLNKKNDVIQRQEVFMVTDQKTIKSLTLAVFDLKKSDEKRIKQVNSLVRIKTTTRIDSIKVAYVDSSERRKFADSVEKTCIDVINYFEATTIQIPKKVIIDSFANKDFQLYGTIQRFYFQIDSVRIPNTQNIGVVETGGWFKRDINKKLKIHQKRKTEIMVINSNKYVDVDGVNSFIYKPKIGGRWGERGIIFAAGAVAAALILK